MFEHLGGLEPLILLTIVEVAFPDPEAAILRSLLGLFLISELLFSQTNIGGIFSILEALGRQLLLGHELGIFLFLFAG